MSLSGFIRRHPVWSFCLLTLLWSYTWCTLVLLMMPPGLDISRLSPAAGAFMFLGSMGPSLVGLALTRVVDGKGRAIALLARLGRWHLGKLWLAVLIPYVVNGAVVVLYILVGGSVSAAGIVVMLGPAIIFGIFAPLAEEFGWRGFMLPQLQRRYSPLVASVLIGLFWGGIWHGYIDYIGIGNLGWRSLPLIILLGPAQMTAQAVLLTMLYNRSRGSLLLCVLFHSGITMSSILFGVTYPSYAVRLAWAMVAVLMWWAVVAGAILLEQRRGHRGLQLRPV